MPPRHHPHWELMVGVIDMLLGFSLLGFVLSCVLSATLIAGFLAPQARQVGVMKALGASDRQIVGMYAALVAVLGVVAVAIGVPLGIASGCALARSVGEILNFDLQSMAVPSGIWVSEAAAGVLLPLLLALWPIVRAARRPVREALDDYGVADRTVVRSVSRGGTLLPAALWLAVRNSLRRRSRLALTLLLLGAAGVLFITSLNLSAAWQRNAAAAVVERHVDLEMAFAGPQPAAAVLALAMTVPGVRGVEEYSAEGVAIARADGINLTHTFPDGGHGSLRLDGVRPDGRFLSAPITVGSWLRADVANAAHPGVVLNPAARNFFPGVRLGELLRVLVRGRVLTLQVVGVIDEHLAPATIYISAADYAAAVEETGMIRGLRISLGRGDEKSALAAADALERSLEAAGFHVAEATSKAQIAKAYGGHFYILIFTLRTMASLMAAVGVLGLGSAMSTSVLERRREFGVLRAIGASSRTVLFVVTGEGLFIAMLSLAFAVLLAIPTTLLVANLVRLPVLGPWRCVAYSFAALPVWSTIVCLSAVVASVLPAHRATRLTLHAALAYQ